MSRLLTAGAGVHYAQQDQTPYLTGLLVHDTFNRANADTPGAGWSDGHAIDPTYCVMGVRSNGLAAAQPTSNDNTGHQPSGSPPYDGIGFVYQDLNTPDVFALFAVLPQSTNLRETTALLNITPGHPYMGVGAWLSSASPTVGFLIVSYIMNPCTDFALHDVSGGAYPYIAGAVFTRTATTRYAEFRSEGGVLTTLLDGVPIPLSVGSTPIGTGFTIHPALTASTLHGIASDNHLDNGTGGGHNQSAPIVDECWFHEL